MSPGRLRAPGCRPGCSAGTSTALWRAYTPGLGSGVTCRPARTRACISSRWVGFGVSRSRCVSTIAPSAAVMSRALVTSKAKTYRVKTRCASPVVLPSALALARPRSGTATMALPMPTISSPAKPSPSTTAAIRCPRSVSTSESDASTPTSMSTNRNSIMTAPV